MGAERKSGPALTKDTAYLALTGEMWGVYCDDLGENLPRYNGTALYSETWKKIELGKDIYTFRDFLKPLRSLFLIPWISVTQYDWR